MGCSLFIWFGHCSQGGGVFVTGGEVTFQSSRVYNNQATGVSFPRFENLPGPFFHRPNGLTLFGICWQGGGVAIGGGTVTFTSCTIYSNTVRACFVNLPGHFFHRPAGLTDLLVSRT